MLTIEKTADYVKRWVAAFESKDLDRVLAFYTDDVIFHSPLIARLSHDPSGTVQGKAALRAYVKKGFEVFDHIDFTVDFTTYKRSGNMPCPSTDTMPTALCMMTFRSGMSEAYTAIASR